jgi:hypothetical protein
MYELGLGVFLSVVKKMWLAETYSSGNCMILCLEIEYLCLRGKPG